ALHAATRAKAGATSGALQSAEERDAAEEMAGALGWGTIHRLWQMLLKGLQDVEIAPNPREAAEMALLRLIHAADMPDPASLLQRLSGEGAVTAPASVPAGKASGPTAKLPADFPALINRLEEGGRHQLAVQLHDQEKMAEERVRADVLADPNVRAVMDAFPDAELESFSTRGP